MAGNARKGSLLALSELRAQNAGMVDTSKRYTAREVSSLEAQGYEFVEMTMLADNEPMWVISAYRDPAKTRDLYSLDFSFDDGAKPIERHFR